VYGELWRAERGNNLNNLPDFWNSFQMRKRDAQVATEEATLWLTIPPAKRSSKMVNPVKLLK
tara:strand:- start:232 stop:417 length:186 start_codon:yes stop_codon:yes gene_type:complete